MACTFMLQRGKGFLLKRYTFSQPSNGSKDLNSCFDLIPGESEKSVNSHGGGKVKYQKIPSDSP
jgi:hypothetical protein